MSFIGSFTRRFGFILYVENDCVYTLKVVQGCSFWEGGGGGAGEAWHPHFNFRTKKGPKISVLNIRDIAFYGCSEIIRTRYLTIFTVYAIIFGQFMAVFHFF